MKRKFLPVILSAGILILCGCAHKQCASGKLFQVSTVRDLKRGDYAGRISLSKLRSKGDFGMGTFEGLDGEMIELDGVVYQAASDGDVYQPADRVKIPFAAVTDFNAQHSFDLKSCADYPELAKLVEEHLTDKEMIYAVKIEGEFAYLKLRSPPKQKAPYPVLEQALKGQAVFEHKNIRGTLVGFWFPEYLSEINSSGIHLHFISADKKSGGHLLEGRFSRIKVELGQIKELKLLLAKKACGIGNIK